MTLRIIAAEEQLKALKLSVQTLGKFGQEIGLEARPGCIHFRSVNQSKSAYVRMTFNSSFFDVYELFEQPVLSASVLSKCLVASMRTQRICRAIFEIFTQANKMNVYIDCENGLQKKFEFDLIDSDALQAQINFDLYPVRITVESSEMSRLLASFQQTLDEVTIIAIPDSQGEGNVSTDKSCQIHSFYDPHKFKMDNTLLHTQLAVNAHQHFLEYIHTGRKTVDVTFNLKDFKVILAYCTSMRNNLSILFSQAGEPLAIVPIPSHEHFSTSDFSSEFVLATMLDSCVDQNGQPSVLLNVTSAPVNNGSSLNKRRAHAAVQEEKHRSHPHQTTTGTTRASYGSDMNTNDAADHLVAMQEKEYSNTTLSHLRGSQPQQPTSKRFRVASQETSQATVSVNNDPSYRKNELHLEPQNDEDDDDEEVPGTPTHERRVDTWIENWS